MAISNNILITEFLNLARITSHYIVLKCHVLKPKTNTFTMKKLQS